jgi:D-glycero-alpha-D-manno-heptose-7-phosphate kinase
MESRPDGEVVVNPLRTRRDVIADWRHPLLLYFGGVSGLSSEDIAERQRNVVERDEDALDATHAIRAEALEMKDLLVVGDIAGFANSLLRGWEAKKRLGSRDFKPRNRTRLSGRGVARYGRRQGLRAGGDDFLMMIVDPRRRIEVARSLERECGGSVAPCLFTKGGATTWRIPARKAKHARGS